MRNLKFVKRLQDKVEKKQETPITYPENWDEITQVIDTKKRQLNKNLDWYMAEQALEEANIANKTEALLVLRAKGMLEERKPVDE